MILRNIRVSFSVEAEFDEVVKIINKNYREYKVIRIDRFTRNEIPYYEVTLESEGERVD